MPDGTRYGYTYNANNHLTNITIPGLRDITYPSYALNRPDSVTFPGGSHQTYAYDDLMRLERITAPEMDYHYTSNDNVGNLLTKQTEHGNYSYGYDAVSRLLMANKPMLADESYTGACPELVEGMMWGIA